jgi:hypothetical protein
MLPDLEESSSGWMIGRALVSQGWLIERVLEEIGNSEGRSPILRHQGPQVHLRYEGCDESVSGPIRIDEAIVGSLWPGIWGPGGIGSISVNPVTFASGIGRVIGDHKVCEYADYLSNPTVGPQFSAVLSNLGAPRGEDSGSGGRDGEAGRWWIHFLGVAAAPMRWIEKIKRLFCRRSGK